MIHSNPECFLCIESISKPVTCHKCSYTTCIPCTKKYILSKNLGAHCMNPKCKINWSNKFLMEFFDKAWVTSTDKNSYREHVKKISVDRERSKLPETLAQIPLYKEREKQNELLQELETQLTFAKNRVKEIQSLIRSVYRESATKTLKNIPRFICPCPTDGCKGLIDSKFFCNLCEHSICKHCRVLLSNEENGGEEKHECNSIMIETVKLLKEDTKSCPKCATPIYKIDGCDQMWCTQCQTAFSWKTGQVEMGVIHNPHAIKWQRKHGQLLRNNGDIPCGGLIPMWEFSMLRGKHYRSLLRIHRRIAELVYDLRSNIPNRNFEDLRKNLILNEITDNEFKQKIFLRERNNARKEENHKILSTYQVLAIERFRELVRQCKKHHKSSPASVLIHIVHKFLLQMDEIRIFINTAFREELPPLGQLKHYIIDSDWKLARKPSLPKVQNTS